MVSSCGGAGRDRTDDLLNAIQALSQLSYSPTAHFYFYYNEAGRTVKSFLSRGEPREPDRENSVGAGFKPAPTKYGLPEIVRGFKTFSSRRINESRGTPGTPVWQRNYYEHIIRNDESLDRIREYIANNPMQWEWDVENSVGAGFKPARP